MTNLKENRFSEIPASLNALTHEISRRISDTERFEHTLSVARECLAIAEIFGFDETDAKRLCTAAFLHDITKGMSLEEFLSLDKKYSVGFTKDDLSCPAVLHAKAGAKVAEREFSHYTDGEICTAIAQHTTGGENMSVMSKILFIADYIEPTRKWDICSRTREEFYRELASSTDIFKTLDRTMIKILEQTEDHLRKNGKKVHPDAVKCKEFILKAIE